MKALLILPAVLLLSSCLSDGLASASRARESDASAPAVKSESRQIQGKSGKRASPKRSRQMRPGNLDLADIDVQLAMWMAHQEDARGSLSYVPGVDDWVIWNQM